MQQVHVCNAATPSIPCLSSPRRDSFTTTKSRRFCSSDGFCSRDASACGFCLILRSPPRNKPRERSAGRRKFTWSRATAANVAACRCLGAAARLFAARSPSGAPLRHSPGRTHPALAQLQFPRFLRPGSTGVTRFRLSAVYRAPRRPVVVPAERWPRAARERFARPSAGAALAPHFGPHPECALGMSKLRQHVTCSETVVKNASRHVAFTVT
jgi:hypothetical protein